MNGIKYNSHSSHSFIYSKFQKKKKKKIQEILRDTFGDGMSKIHHLSYRCEKTFEASDTELEKSLVKVFDYFFPQSGNEHRDFVKVL